MFGLVGLAILAPFSKCSSDICHRDIHPFRIIRIVEWVKTKIFIKAPAAVEMFVFKHIKNDCGGPHLLRDADTPFHGIDDEGVFDVLRSVLVNDVDHDGNGERFACALKISR